MRQATCSVWRRLLTIQDVNRDAFGLSIRRVALVATGVRRPGLLDEQKAGGRLPLLCDDTDATTRRIVTDYLEPHEYTRSVFPQPSISHLL